MGSEHRPGLSDAFHLKNTESRGKYMRRNCSAYDTEKTYTYFSVDGTAVVLTAGEDGVTEEHIQNLRSLQQLEYNNNRKARRHQLSLERFMENAEERSEVLIDLHVDIEDDLIRKMERACLQDKLSAAWGQLLPQQRALLVKVWIQKMTLTQIAKDEGVAISGVFARLQRAEKKLKKLVGRP
jgi:DNA-directed RNA polymerase specialized sigma subunit